MAVSVVSQPPEVRRVGAAAVFNLPLTESYFVLDLRPPEAHAASHIVSAVSLPALPAAAPAAARAAQLNTVLAELLDTMGLPERVSPVVLVPAGPALTPEEQAQVTFLTQLLGQRQQAEAAAATHGLTAGPGGVAEAVGAGGWHAHALERLQQFCHELWLLDGGHAAFEAQFPHLCGTDLALHMVPTQPHYIADNLLLGSRAVRLGAETLLGMNVRHVICNADGPQRPDTYLNQPLQLVSEVQYFVVDVADNNATEMAAVWDACLQFIAEAAGARVLVQLHGRSRSASVCMAYLMRVQRMSFEQAWEHLVACCPAVDSSLIYADQLRAYAPHCPALGPDDDQQ